MLECYYLFPEEEMKRFKEALSQDGAYASVGFSYDSSEQENTVENIPSSTSNNCNQPQGTYWIDSK